MPPLISNSEITVETLMLDLPVQRSSRNQLEMQLMVLDEGLQLTFNPVERQNRIERYVVGDFETLPIISTRLFGSPDYWRAIAEANGLEYPYLVRPGQFLTIPEVNRD